MSRSIIAKYVNPWKFRRDAERERRQALRQRDGDNCRRCRRPMRFDLPNGHDLAPKIEEIPVEVMAASGGVSASMAGSDGLDRLCLCHGRCNSESADFTAEVLDRIRRKAESELLSRGRARKHG